MLIQGDTLSWVQQEVNNKMADTVKSAPQVSAEDQAFQSAASKLNPADDEEANFQPLAGASTTKKPLGLGVPTTPGTPIGKQSLDNIWDKTIDFIRPWVGYGAGTLGATGGATVGALGGPAAPITVPAGAFAGDVAGYGLADMALQNLKVKQPNSQAEAMSESSRDALINAVGGRILNGVTRGLGAFRNTNVPEIYKLFPTSSQAMESAGIKALPGIARAIEDVAAPGAKEAARLRSGGAGFFEALDLANMFNGKGRVFNQDPKQLLESIKTTLRSGVTQGANPKQFQTPLHYVSKEFTDALEGGQDPFSVLRDTVHDDKQLQKMLDLGQKVGGPHMNVRDDLAAFHISDLMNRATQMKAPTSGGQPRALIDPEMIEKEWFDPKMEGNLTKLYGAQGKQTLDTLMRNIVNTQQDNMINSKVRQIGKGLLIGGGGLGTLFSGHLPVGATGGGLYITFNTLGRALTNPKFARALTAMMGGEPASAGTAELGRQILSGLQGARAAMIDTNGNKTWGTPLMKPDGSYEMQR